MTVGDFTIKEIETTVRSRYAHIEWSGTANNNTPAGNDNPYIRVGCTYYKVVKKVDRYGIEKKELKVWNKDTLIQDDKKSFLRTIPVLYRIDLCANCVKIIKIIKESEYPNSLITNCRGGRIISSLCSLMILLEGLSKRKSPVPPQA